MAVYCKALGVYLGPFLNRRGNRGTDEQRSKEQMNRGISNIEQGISNVEGRIIVENKEHETKLLSQIHER